MGVELYPGPLYGYFESGHPATVPLTVKGASGQTAQLLSIVDSGNTSKFAVDASGRLTVKTDSSDATTLILKSNLVGTHKVGLYSSATDGNWSNRLEFFNGTNGIEAYLMSIASGGLSVHVGNGVSTISEQVRFATDNNYFYKPVKIQSGSDALYLERYSANVSGPFIYTGKSRNATSGSHTIVNSGDSLGGIVFRGSNGTGWSEAASITAIADGTPGATNDMPGRIVFHTTPDGSGTLAERMRIDSAGLVSLGDGAALVSPREKATTAATAATGTVNFDAKTQGVLFYTSNAGGNWTLNIRGDSGTTLNSVLAVGQSITVVFLVQQGATPYYQSGFQVDGSAVTPKWQGGTAPTAGNASSIDAYAITVIKTAATPTYTILESLTKFA